jgi:DNA-binding CsgD family transcriptional regulator
MAQSAAETAVAYLRRAYIEPPQGAARVAVLRELGAAEALAHDPLAIEHLECARLAEDDPRARAEIALELASALLVLFRSVQACRVLESAVADLDPAAHELRARLDAAIVSAAFLDAATIETGARVLAERAADPPPGAPGRAIHVQLAQTMVLTGQPAQRAREMADPAIAAAGEEDLWTTFETGLVVLVLAEAFDSAAELIDRCGGLPSVRIVRRRAASLEAVRGFLAARLGALEPAEMHLRMSIELTPEHTSPGGWLVVLGWLSDVLTLRGNLDEAERTLASAPAEPWPVHVGAGFALAARARLRFAQGRLQEGLRDLDSLADRERPWALVGPAVHHWRPDAAIALLALGREDDARDLAGEDLLRARAYGAPRTLGIALRAAGIAQGAADGLELLREAASILEATPARLEHARALVALGAALRRANRRADARGPLAEALDLAYRCGSPPIVEAARVELQACGARPRRLVLSGVDALTPSERRVAEMAASGMSNAAIARALFITRATVQTHLTRVYRKLDIASREALHGALRSHESA